MFDEHELGILIEALNAWTKEKTTNGLVGDMMMAVLAPPERREEMMAKRDRDREAVLKESQSREEEATIIKAKLIGMKRKLVAEGLFVQQKEIVT